MGRHSVIRWLPDPAGPNHCQTRLAQAPDSAGPISSTPGGPGATDSVGPSQPIPADRILGVRLGQNANTRVGRLPAPGWADFPASGWAASLHRGRHRSLVLQAVVGRSFLCRISARSGIASYILRPSRARSAPIDPSDRIVATHRTPLPVAARQMIDMSACIISAPVSA